jgi:hypothetical protein
VLTRSRLTRGAAILGVAFVVVMAGTTPTPPTTIDLTIAQEASP